MKSTKETAIMKTFKAALLSIFLTSMPLISHATDINLSVPCKDSGSLNITGTYDDMSGTVNFTLTPQDCKENGYSITGTGSVKGTFKPSMTDYGKFDTDLKTTMDAMFTKDSDHIHAVYNLTAKGAYDLATSKFNNDAHLTYSIDMTGPVPCNIIDLITVDWEAITG
jgi:hypothetical protein